MLGTGPFLGKGTTWRKYSWQGGMQENGKERQLAGKALDERKVCIQRRKACKASMQEDLTMLGFW
jgi:hypothetical protein